MNLEIINSTYPGLSEKHIMQVVYIKAEVDLCNLIQPGDDQLNAMLQYWASISTKQNTRENEVINVALIGLHYIPISATQ